MHPILNVAVKAARLAGKTISQNAYLVDRMEFDRKDSRDYVTEIDRQAEGQIVEVIRKAYPDHSIVAEEGSRVSGNDVQWIIDPLDGTTNYMHNVPQYSVSIAVRERDKLQHAVVFEPLSGELYTASRGRGAHLNDRRIRASKTHRLEHCLIGTGFPFRETDQVDAWIRVFKELAKKTSGIRRPGSAALDLAYVAAGRYDGFWESGLKSWDMAAGVLLIEEAGGMVSDFEGGKRYLDTGQVIAANHEIFEELQDIVRMHSGA